MAEKNSTPEFARDIWENLAKWLHKQKKYDPKSLADPEPLAAIRETHRILSQPLQEMKIGQEIPEELTAALNNNIFYFSGFKTHHELVQASRMLKDSDGNFKPFHKFLNDIETLNKTYNKNYLRAEYNFATASTQMAIKWKEWEQDEERYNLQYRTAGDDRVREEHAALNGVTLPPSDPFWNSYLPPNGWNCRCTTVQVRKNKYPQSNSEKAMAAGAACTAKPKQQIFRFNPGKTMTVFPPKHPYYKANGEVKKTVEKITSDETLDYRLQSIIDTLKKTKIDYIEPRKLELNTTEEQIIERLSGDDKTQGSCSSLAFAYAGNKAGFDVLDFRDGESRSFFSSGLNINNIISNAGGKIESSVNDFKSAKICLETTEKGKEYYFACGKHAAIVRKIDEGKYEYLELQSKKFKGWHTLTEYELKRRFGAKSSHSLYGHKYEAKSFIINIELLQNCSDFKEVLGYINTCESKQNKGEGGSMK